MPAADPETSNTTSAPAPSLSSRTRAATSSEPGSSASSPSSSASPRRVTSGSTTSTRAPRARATSAIRSPIGPPPMTTASWPSRTSPRRTSWQATASGSASAPRRRSTVAGSACRVKAGTVHDRCSAPGASIPRNLRPRLMWLRPRSAGVSPRGSSGRTTTSSPGWKPSTPSPISATVPDISCPITCGGRTRASIAPCAMCRSVPQTPQYATSSRTSPAAGGRAWPARTENTPGPS